ncbi:MAG: hypothetical protein KGL39_10955 [Patescibacteria group bacterium]|nr:hypothetical protein [Patescibacteria group bacterium]
MPRKKLTLVGLVATPDAYGRPRILLLEELKSGKKDYSATTLAKCIPESTGTLPYRLWRSQEGVIGEFWVIMPKRKERAAYFMDVYEKNRSKEVKVEVSLRHYTLVTEDGNKKKGVCLDLIDIEETN